MGSLLKWGTFFFERSPNALKGQRARRNVGTVLCSLLPTTRRSMNPLNQCSVCSADFASLAAFDDHILSKPSDPVFACMTVAEMESVRWTQNERGRWTSPKLAAKAEKLAEYHLAA
jgi:hypothetical protein